MKNLILIAGTPSSVSSTTMEILNRHGCELNLPIPTLGEVRANNEMPAVWEVSRRAHKTKYGLEHSEKDFAIYGKTLLFKWAKPCVYEDRLIDKGVEIIATCGPLQALKLPLSILIWDFWEAVFSRVEELPSIVVGMLFRNPQEVAESWVRRFGGTLEAVYPILEAYSLCQRKVIETSKVKIVPLRIERNRYATDLAALLDKVGVTFDPAKFESVFKNRSTLFTDKKQDHPVFRQHDELLTMLD